jgi:hypothetical protein
LFVCFDLSLRGMATLLVRLAQSAGDTNVPKMNSPGAREALPLEQALRRRQIAATSSHRETSWRAPRLAQEGIAAE